MNKLDLLTGILGQQRTKLTAEIKFEHGVLQTVKQDV